MLWAYPNVGLGLIVLLPMIYIINTAVVYLYFRFAKNKTMFGKILVLLATLLVTSFMYSESYGENRGVSVFFRMLHGDFGHTSWTRESVRIDNAQITHDGILEYHLERVHRSTPLQSSPELRLFARDLRTGAEYHIRLDDVMNETQLPSPTVTHGRDVFWSTMRNVGEIEQKQLLITTSSFDPVRRWVFELDMETQIASLLEQIHVGSLGRLEDDIFIAHLYMVNFFDNPYRSIRLAMTDTETWEIIQIPIAINAAEVIVQNFDFNWSMISPAVWAMDEETGERYLAQPPKRVVGVELTDLRRVYYVILREGFLESERRFELDMNTRTMTELR